MYKGIEKLRSVTAEEIIADISKKYKFWSEHKKGIYIFGTELLGQFVYDRCKENRISVLGFINNNKEKQGGSKNKLPIIPLEEVDKNSIIIIAALNYWYEIKKQLKQLEFNKYLCYEELAVIDAKYPSYNQSFYNLIKSLIDNKSNYIRCFELLEDERSREIFDLIIMFRLTYDIEYTYKAYELSLQDGKQYFDSKIVSPRENEVFVEGGGFNGDTICDFIDWNGGRYKKIYFFEPDINMLNVAAVKLGQDKRIEYINCGLGARREYLNYSSMNSTGGGLFENHGAVETDRHSVEIVTVDEYIDDIITFIALDVEGFEMNILQGASECIKEHKPRLAISGYHKPNDLFEIMDYVRSINSKYKIYIRHYSKTYGDTVIYFV